MKESSRVPNLKCCPGIFLEGLSKTTKTLSQGSWSPGRDLNPGRTDYEAEVVIIRCR
jgi:hypothetical protein